MSRVLLFVGGPKGRPVYRCIARVREQMTMQQIHPGYWVWWWRHDEAQHQGWWLVECENAEAGRAAIGFQSIGGHTSRYFYSARLGRNVKGRVLASGGAQ